MEKLFNKIQKMCDNNMDISCSTTMLEINKCKQGAIIQVGVSEDCIPKLASDEYMFCLLVINKKQLSEIQD